MVRGESTRASGAISASSTSAVTGGTAERCWEKERLMSGVLNKINQSQQGIVAPSGPKAEKAPRKRSIAYSLPFDAEGVLAHFWDISLQSTSRSSAKVQT